MCTLWQWSAFLKAMHLLYCLMYCVLRQQQRMDCDYQRGHLIWFNPMTQTSTVCLLFLAFALWVLIKREWPSNSQHAGSNTDLSPLCLCLQDKHVHSDGDFHAVYCMVKWFCGVSVSVHHSVGDLRPSTGARRMNSRATQTGEYADIHRCHSRFLFRNDSDNQSCI